MSHREPARTTSRRSSWILVAGPLVLIAAIGAGLGDRLLAASPPVIIPPTSTPIAAPPSAAGPSAPRGPLGEADGVVPEGTTVFDDGVPGVANLDPALLSALRRAAADAADEGIRFVVNSGWRSAAYQAQLLREAVAKYGSEARAARWVGSPTTSAHVSGDAVDLGPAEATTWLSLHGARYGLCQIYRNEPWHFELRSADHGCPAMYTDPTHDPRMQQ